MTDNELIKLGKKALPFHEAGLGYRAIAEKLGGAPINKDNIAKALKLLKAQMELDEQDESEELEENEIGEEPQPTNKPLGRIGRTSTRAGGHFRTTLDPELHRQQLDVEREGHNIERQRLAILDKKADTQALLATLKEQELDLQAEQAITQRLQGGRKLVAKFKKLLHEFLDSCQDSDWEREDVLSFIDDLLKLKGKVIKQAAMINYNETELVIYHGIEALLECLQELLEEQDGEWVEIDLDDEQKEEFSQFQVNNFEAIVDEEYGDGEDDDQSQTFAIATNKTDIKPQQCVRQVNELVEEISEAIDDEEFWDQKDVDTFSAKVQTAKKDVVKLAKSLDLDLDSLQIAETLEMLVEHVKECRQNFKEAQGNRSKLVAYYGDEEEAQEDKMIKMYLDEDLADENTLLEDYSVEEFDDVFIDEDDE